jgi:hypothetical protein
LRVGSSSSLIDVIGQVGMSAYSSEAYRRGCSLRQKNMRGNPKLFSRGRCTTALD